MANDNTKVKIPTKKQVVDKGKSAIVAGLMGGAGVALGSALLGVTLGAPVGAIVAGAAVGGTKGDIVAINGVMDGAVSMFVGGNSSGSAGVM